MKVVITTLVKVTASFSLIAAVLYLTNFVGGESRWGWVGSRWSEWLRLGAGVCVFLSALAAALLALVFFLIVAAWVFFPIALKQHRTPSDKLRSIVMPLVSALCFAWLRSFPAEGATNKIHKIHASIIVDISRFEVVRGIGPEPVRVGCDAVIALVTATAASVALIVLWALIRALLTVLRRYLSLMDSVGRFLSGLVGKLIAGGSDVRGPVLKPASSPRGLGQVVPILLGCLLIDLPCAALFLSKGDWVALAVVATGVGVAISMLHGVMATGTGGPSLSPVGTLPAVALALAAFAFLFYSIPDSPDDASLITFDGATWNPVIRVVLRDLVFAIVLTQCVARLLTARWRGLNGYAARIERRLWYTISGYLGLKAGAILLSLGASAFFAPMEAVERSQDPNGPAPALRMTRIEPSDFVFMAWSGEVLQADEFLFARSLQAFRKDDNSPSTSDNKGEGPKAPPTDKPKELLTNVRTFENHVNQETFKAVSEKYRYYYEPRFIVLVLLQSVFGWHYGITPLCYLLFAFALFVFRWPAPASGETAGAYLARKNEIGAVDRVREAANAIVTLGFVGTLLGLSQSIFFLGAADPLTEYLHRSSISSRLTGSLGLGFFCTFVSMILRLLLYMRFSQLAGDHAGYQLQLQTLADQG